MNVSRVAMSRERSERASGVAASYQLSNKSRKRRSAVFPRSYKFSRLLSALFPRLRKSAPTPSRGTRRKERRQRRPRGEECNSIKDASPAPCVAFSTFLRLLPYFSRLFLSLMLPRKSEGARWRRLRARQLSSIPDSIFTHNFTWILCDVCPPWACQFI